MGPVRSLLIAAVLILSATTFGLWWLPEAFPAPLLWVSAWALGLSLLLALIFFGKLARSPEGVRGRWGVVRMERSPGRVRWEDWTLLSARVGSVDRETRTLSLERRLFGFRREAVGYPLEHFARCAARKRRRVTQSVRDGGGRPKDIVSHELSLHLVERAPRTGRLLLMDLVADENAATEWMFFQRLEQAIQDLLPEAPSEGDSSQDSSSKGEEPKGQGADASA